MAELDELLALCDHWIHLGSGGRAQFFGLLRGTLEPVDVHPGTLGLILGWIRSSWLVDDYPELQPIYDRIQEHLSPYPDENGTE